MIRPRFSIRTLLVVIALAGGMALIGSWHLTLRFGVTRNSASPDQHRLAEYLRVVEALGSHLDDNSTPIPAPSLPILSVRTGFDSSPAPFCISRMRFEVKPNLARREYHFWFIGFSAKLPIERRVKFDSDELKSFLRRGLES